MKRAFKPAVLGDAAAAKPALPTMPIAALDDLDEITAWLGTFRVRLNAARAAERDDVQMVLGELETRYRQRRAELA
jgi:hypothetical protein